MEIKSYLLPFFSLLLLFSCEVNKDSETTFNVSTFVVASQTIECQGEAPQQCLLVKTSENQQNWQFFYSNIDGFKHQEGYEYVIIVEETPIKNPPQDGSSIAYTLIEVVSKIEKTSANLTI